MASFIVEAADRTTGKTARLTVEAASSVDAAAVVVGLGLLAGTVERASAASLGAPPTHIGPPALGVQVGGFLMRADEKEVKRVIRWAVVDGILIAWLAVLLVAAVFGFFIGLADALSGAY